jgi:hypothetical protein
MGYVPGDELAEEYLVVAIGLYYSQSPWDTYRTNTVEEMHCTRLKREEKPQRMPRDVPIWNHWTAGRTTTIMSSGSTSAWHTSRQGSGGKSWSGTYNPGTSIRI